MSNTLKDFIIKQIHESGPMSVGQFMSVALGHPVHGYYMKQDPFGRSTEHGGDFITAPEVSQIFGEMIGVWVADIWAQMGRPGRFIFLECGPGRGTLMADMMRATKNVAGFHKAAQIHLLEISPVLKVKQKAALEGYDVRWHDVLDGVPRDAPMIAVGNEFLDALPFQQFINGVERMIDVRDGDLVFVPQEGEIVERSIERLEFVKDLCGRLKTQGGAALFIDYGHIESGPGDTFQAIKGHEYVDVLSHIGDADLTSHVDFAALKVAAEISVAGPVPQGAFLKALGIDVRAQILAQKADEQQREDLEKGLQRLVGSDQMGELFKVIGFYHHDKPLTPAGF